MQEGFIGGGGKGGSIVIDCVAIVLGYGQGLKKQMKGYVWQTDKQ